jgi:hypothetical protein
VTFRCSNCHGVVWVPDSELPRQAKAPEVDVRCRKCARSFQFNAWSRVCTQGSAVAAEARRMVLGQGLDLPAAYSVALGIMTLEQVLAACPERPATGSAGPRSGSRPTIVKRLGAFDALRWVAYVVILVAGLSYLATARRPTTAPADAPSVRAFAEGDAQVIADDRGRVLQISAPDPWTVLRAYCRLGRLQGRLQALDVVVPAVSPQGRRLGLLRDPATPQTVHAIPIEEDPTSGAWVSGDGRRVLEPEIAPEWAQTPLTATRVPDS